MELADCWLVDSFHTPLARLWKWRCPRCPRLRPFFSLRRVVLDDSIMESKQRILAVPISSLVRHRFQWKEAMITHNLELLSCSDLVHSAFSSDIL